MRGQERDDGRPAGCSGRLSGATSRIRRWGGEVSGVGEVPGPSLRVWGGWVRSPSALFTGAVAARDAQAVRVPHAAPRGSCASAGPPSPVPPGVAVRAVSLFSITLSRVCVRLCFCCLVFLFISDFFLAPPTIDSVPALSDLGGLKRERFQRRSCRNQGVAVLPVLGRFCLRAGRTLGQGELEKLRCGVGTAAESHAVSVDVCIQVL